MPPGITDSTVSNRDDAVVGMQEYSWQSGGSAQVIEWLSQWKGPSVEDGDDDDDETFFDYGARIAACSTCLPDVDDLHVSRRCPRCADEGEGTVQGADVTSRYDRIFHPPVTDDICFGSGVEKGHFYRGNEKASDVFVVSDVFGRGNEKASVDLCAPCAPCGASDVFDVCEVFDVSCVSEKARKRFALLGSAVTGWSVTDNVELAPFLHEKVHTDACSTSRDSTVSFDWLCVAALTVHWHQLFKWVHPNCLQPVTAAFMRAQHQPWGVLEKCQLCIDGTGACTDGKRPAWGVVIFELYSCGNYRCCGVVNGPVITDPEHPHFLGVSHAAVGSAELSAQIWAAFITLQAGYDHVEILYDSKFAEGISDASTRPTVHRAAAKLAAGLRTAMEHKGIVTSQHIHSHNGHPLNEFADSACEWAAAGQFVSTLPHLPIQKLLENECFLARWAFLWFTTDDIAAQYCKPGGRDELFVPGSFDEVQLTPSNIIAEHFDLFQEEEKMMIVRPKRSGYS